MAECAREAGLRITYDPRLVVEHHEHGTTRHLLSGKVAHWQYEALSCLLRLYFGDAE